MASSILKVGDLVKVKGKTFSGGIEKELLPIGTICEVVSVCGNCIEIKPAEYLLNVGYWYDSDVLEKGNLVWMPERSDYGKSKFVCK